MKDESIIPFDDILSSLFAEEMGSIPQLYRLSDMDDEDFTKFLLHWNGASDDRRQVIVRHLADISEHNFIVDFAPIFTISLQDSYAPVRIAALDGLWDSTDSTLVDPILNLLTLDPDPKVREAAARSIAHFLLMSEWDHVRGINKNYVFNTLLDTYDDPITELPLKCAVLEAMGPIPLPRVSKIIEEAYEGFSPELQLSAVFAMGTSADPRWAAILLDEMESPVEEMRAEAARAAGLIGLSEAIPQLAELVYDDDLDVAAVAITSIGQIGGSEAESILQDLLSDLHAEHLHEVAEEALEEASWIDGELPMFPWSEDEMDDDVPLDELN
jgi:HEAT repeat protein